MNHMTIDPNELADSILRVRADMPGSMQRYGWKIKMRLLPHHQASLDALQVPDATLTMPPASLRHHLVQQAAHPTAAAQA